MTWLSPLRPSPISVARLAAAALVPLGLAAALPACGGGAQVSSPRGERAERGERSAPGPAAAHCRPGQACWPSAADWQALRAQVHGRLEEVHAPLEPCRTDPASPACSSALASITNPFYLQDQPGGTEVTGWLDAWTPAPSAYAVAAETTDDIAAAIRFARDHHLRLAIKGTGHDYLGRSSAPDSLLIWTHRMRQVTVHDAFVARGCPGEARGVPAVTVEAGARWIEAYRAVTVEHGRYVQGGGCTSVGAAGGFLQGGGFGSWSKKYGIAAAGLLEAEVVTADGSVVTASACQHADLFWALRGGGGGTFGVVTRATLMTHPLPDYVGSLTGEITAKSDAAFRELLARFIAFYRQALSDEHWGEQVAITRDNALQLSLTFEGMRARDAEAIWRPFRAWVEQHPDRFAIRIATVDLPATQMWSAAFFQKYAADAIRPDTRPGQPAGQFWWAGDADQVSAYLYAYGSRWIPQAAFEEAHAAALADALFRASRHHAIRLHINKGQAGASADAIARGRDTAINPAVFRAAALAIVADGGRGAPGVPGHAPDLAAATSVRDEIHAAMQILRAATPDAGS
ncbi:MAG TPA: FAD-binding protein, partial [Kofleriaceae bacterium]|nr:FAD-binding protein [Kofleriaceae bacterium]